MIYLIVGIILIISEMFVGAFWLFALGVASLITSVLYFCIPEFGYVHQAIALISLSALSPFLVKAVKRYGPKNDASLNKPLDRYVDQVCHAEESFERGRGRVVLNGSTWSAVSASGFSYSAGDVLKVVSAGSDGVLIVKACE